MFNYLKHPQNALKDFATVVGPQKNVEDIAEEALAKIPKQEQYVFNSIVVADGELYIFDKDKQALRTVEARGIRKSVFLDKSFLYALQDRTLVYDNEIKANNEAGKYNVPGLYLYDYNRIMTTGKVESYKIRAAVAGACSHLDFSDYMNRISFMSDYNFIEVVPLAHLNVVNFFGIKPK